MPLSEREQKILQEIERDLYREDPAFARDVRRRPSLSHLSRARLGALLLVAGFITLFVFFAKQSLVVGVASFAAMVAGVVLMAGSLRALATQREQPQRPPRERLSRALKQWEERFRDRYKGR